MEDAATELLGIRAKVPADIPHERVAHV